MSRLVRTVYNAQAAMADSVRTIPTPGAGGTGAVHHQQHARDRDRHRGADEHRNVLAKQCHRDQHDGDRFGARSRMRMRAWAQPQRRASVASRSAWRIESIGGTPLAPL